MKTIITIFGIILVLTLIVKTIFGKTTDKNMIEKISDPEAFLVDVRTPEEFDEAHLTGSVNIPLDVLEDHLDKFKDKKYIVVFCKSGIRSHQAKSILESHKFENVINGKTWTNVSDIVKKP